MQRHWFERRGAEFFWASGSIVMKKDTECNVSINWTKYSLPRSKVKPFIDKVFPIWLKIGIDRVFQIYRIFIKHSNISHSNKVIKLYWSTNPNRILRSSLLPFICLLSKNWVGHRNTPQFKLRDSSCNFAIIISN